MRGDGLEARGLVVIACLAAGCSEGLPPVSSDGGSADAGLADAEAEADAGLADAGADAADVGSEATAVLVWLPEAPRGYRQPEWTALSGNGEVLAGVLSSTAAHEVRPYVWKRDAVEAFDWLPLPDRGRVYGRVRAASEDGTILVGEVDIGGAIWSPSRGLEVVMGVPHGVSADGSKLVLRDGNGIRFDSRIAGGSLPAPVSVPCPDGGLNPYVSALDPSGLFAVGNCAYAGVPDQRAVLFDGKLPGSQAIVDFGVAYAVAADGAAVAGAYDVDGGLHAFRWSRTGGFEALPGPASDTCYARAISRDGLRVAGWCAQATSPGGVALVWEHGRASPLRDLAQAEGVALDGFSDFGDVQFMSYDGRTFVGSGLNPQTRNFGHYWLRLSR